MDRKASEKKGGERKGSKAKRGESLKKKTEKRGRKKQKDIELFNNVNSFIGEEDSSREY